LAEVEGEKQKRKSGKRKVEIRVHLCPSVVGFVFEDEEEDEDDSVINNTERQAILKVREIAGS
jgi:hypothetical protein